MVFLKRYRTLHNRLRCINKVKHFTVARSFAGCADNNNPAFILKYRTSGLFRVRNIYTTALLIITPARSRTLNLPYYIPSNCTILDYSQDFSSKVQDTTPNTMIVICQRYRKCWKLSTKFNALKLPV